jgi:hypothetical protein
MVDPIEQVKRAIREGDKAKARQMLKKLLRVQPSADAWTLAAIVSDDKAQKIKALQRALTIDEWHTTANRMLMELQDVKSASERGYEVDTGFQRELESSQAEAREKGSFFGNLLRGLRQTDDDQADQDEK